MGFSLKKLLNPKDAFKRDRALLMPTSTKDLNPLGKVMSDGKKTVGPAAAAPTGPANPYAQFGYTPGIGYGTGAGGQNPFAGVMQNIPAGFFQNPQAMAALSQALGNPGAAAPSAGPSVNTPGLGGGNPWASVLGRVPGTPGPAPSQATMMGQVGGFGNGGGKMTMPGKISGGKMLVRAK